MPSAIAERRATAAIRVALAAAALLVAGRTAAQQTVTLDASAGPSPYAPSLPADTPREQVERDPARPVTTLSEAIERSYWTNPNLLSERARARSVDFRVPEARGGYGPQLEYSLGYGYRHDTIDVTTTSSIVRAGWASTASAVLTQPVFTFGRLRASEDAARAQVAFQHASLRASEHDLLFRVLAAYASVLRDRAGTQIARENLQLLDRQLSDERARLAQRESTATDVGQIQARTELAQAQMLTSQAQSASSESAFLRFVGAPAGELAAPNPLTIPVRTLEDAYVYADAHNAVIASAYARERISRAQKDRARAELLPRIDLGGEAARGSVSPYSDDLRTTELRGTVTVSGVLDSGIRQSQLGEASAANDADWRLIDEAIRENREEVADAWNAWQSQAASVARLQIAVEAAQSAYDGSVLQQRAGLRTTTELLELARDLLQVKSELNGSMASAYVQQARLLAAIGALDHAYLLPDAPAYHADDHYDAVKRRGDVPLLTPMVRALDSATSAPQVDRPVRDPAAPLATAPAPLESKAP